MLISEEALQHWMTHFYGYGHWQARFWLVGYEESGGDLPEEVAEKLNYFMRYHADVTHPTLCDIRAMYREVLFRTEGPRAERFENFHEHRFGPQPVVHGFWKNLTAFCHGYLQRPVPDLVSYQQSKLASPTGLEALLVFYPLPAHSHAWYYGWLDVPSLPFLKTRARYEAQLFSPRMETLLAQVKRYRPEMVLMYGMNNVMALKKSVQDHFPEARFRTYKAIPHQLPQHHRADVAGTTLLITTQIPGLHHNRKETGFDWKKLGQEVRKNTSA